MHHHETRINPSGIGLRKFHEGALRSPVADSWIHWLRLANSAQQNRKGCPMAIALTCPSCARELKVKDELAGRKIKCPKCGKVIAVLDKKSNSDARITAKAR